jgi:tetratricopeptide (TPR) repeat protein
MKTFVRFAAVVVAVLVGAACSRDPNVAKRKYVESGNRYYDRGKYKEALIMYRNALKKDPKYGEAYYRSALTEMKLGAWDAAVKDFHRSLDTWPTNEDTYSKLVDIYLTAAQNPRIKEPIFNELRGLEARLAKHLPNSFELYRLQGHLALDRKEYPQAIAFFQQANRLKPNQPAIVLPLMAALRANGQQLEAERLALETLEKNPQAMPVYDALYLTYRQTNRLSEAESLLKRKIEKNPKDGQSYLQLALHYASLQQRDAMLSAVNQLVDRRAEIPQARRLAGDFLLRVREVQAGLEQYQKGIQENPKEKAAYQKRAIEALIFLQRNDEANRMLEEVLKENPKDFEALAIRASLRLLSGNPQQLQGAIQDLQSAISKAPENPVLRFNLGRAYMAKGDLQQARVQLEEAIRLRPDYTLPKLMLGQLLISTGEWGRAQQISQEVLSQEENNLVARLIYTRALIGVGDAKQARIELEKVLKLEPNNMEARMQLAGVELAERKFQAAEAAFRSVYNQTRNPQALLGLAEVYSAQGQFDKAAGLLRTEAGRDPDNPAFNSAMASIAARAKSYDEAITFLQRALQKQPNAADLWYRLGELHQLKGDLANAEKAFLKARELAPENPQPIIQLALIQEARGQRQQAQPLYEQVLKLNPDHPVALNNLAYRMAEAGADLDRALELARRARQRMPDNADIADTLGFVYLKKKLAGPAVEMFRESVKRAPNNPTYRLHLATALAEQGDKVSARRELEAALQAKPSKDDEAKIRELMQKLG